MLSALHHRAAELGERVRLMRTATYSEALAQVDEPLEVCAPTSRAADEFVRRRDGVQVLAERGWVMSRDQFEAWARGRSRLRLEDYYREVRVRLGVLMEGDGSHF